MVLHDDTNWPRAGAWFKKTNGESNSKIADIAIVGVGASKSAITPNNADTTPQAIRDALLRYSTYHAGKDVDLQKLSAFDFGDLSNPDDQDKSISELKTLLNQSKTLILMGGDNSITYSGVSALAAESFAEVGVITLDAHHDVRDGISNGSPIRQLVEVGLPGKNIVQIGINDFANSKFYAERVKNYGITVIHRSEFDSNEISNIAKLAFEKLNNCTKIYLDIDIDVCDRSVVPAAPASVPGGISANQLRQIVAEIAADRRVNTFDITEIDASIDATDQRTTRLAALCILEIAAAKANN
jgi:formiminoglutamase